VVKVLPNVGSLIIYVKFIDDTLAEFLLLSFKET
jgi:hypothetical protein